MSEVLVQGHLSVDEHIERIEGCLQRTRQSIFDTIVSIKECYEQVGKDVFQTEVSTRLGIHPSTLSRWIQIGNSMLIMDHKESLPPTFSSLYELTRLEKKYVDFYGEKNGTKKLEHLIEGEFIHSTSEKSDIQEYLKGIEDKLKKRKKQQREKDLLSLGGEETDLPTNTTDINTLVESNQKFRTFLIPQIPPELLKGWGTEMVDENDIVDRFPLVDLRYPSVDQTVLCLLGVPMNHIHTGIKVLTSFGFTYRDVYVPTQRKGGLVSYSKEVVFLRGERGPKSIIPERLKSGETEDLLKFLEDVCEGPHLLVFDETYREGWTCLQIQ